MNTLDLAVGRLISGRLVDEHLDSKTESALQQGTIGGIVLFAENAIDLPQLFDLVQTIKSTSLHPLILSVDQEGGAVQRFSHVLSPLPSAMALAATNNEALVKQIAEINAKQLELLDLNCCFWPVLDVLNNILNPIISTRAFGSNPKTVSQLASIVMEAFRATKVLPVGKHFPGHGGTSEDSHSELAINPDNSSKLWQRDLLPFRNCLAQMPALLVGHIWLKELDQEPMPASLSTLICQGILRDYLHYNGLVFTDDMTMQAITKHCSIEEAAVRAIEAGADHVLVCGDIEQSLAAQKALVEAVNSGRLSEKCIAASIDRLNRNFGKSKTLRTIEQNEMAFSNLKHSIAANDKEVLSASIQAITILRGNIPEIDSEEWLVFVPNHARYQLPIVPQLTKLLNNPQAKSDDKLNPLRFKEIRYSINPSLAEAEALSKECVKRNCLYLTFRSLLNQGQIILAKLIKENAKEHLHIACDSPYDLLGLADWQNCLASYDPSELAMKALAQVILGKAQANGTCPVDLNTSPS